LSKAKPNRLASKAVVLDCQVNTLRTSVRFRFPPPIHNGQPLSVGPFCCRFLRVCGGFCGCLRTSPTRRVVRSKPDFALSGPFFSRTLSRQNFEVRKHQNFARYESVGYSRTYQTVGWRHCLGGGNHLPAANYRIRSNSVANATRSICLIMPSAKRRQPPSAPR